MENGTCTNAGFLLCFKHYLSSIKIQEKRNAEQSKQDYWGHYSPSPSPVRGAPASSVLLAKGSRAPSVGKGATGVPSQLTARINPATLSPRNVHLRKLGGRQFKQLASLGRTLLSSCLLLSLLLVGLSLHLIYHCCR